MHLHELHFAEVYPQHLHSCRRLRGGALTGVLCWACWLGSCPWGFRWSRGKKAYDEVVLGFDSLSDLLELLLAPQFLSFLVGLVQFGVVCRNSFRVRSLQLVYEATSWSEALRLLDRRVIFYRQLLRVLAFLLLRRGGGCELLCCLLRKRALFYLSLRTPSDAESFITFIVERVYFWLRRTSWIHVSFISTSS